jgi:hypothetical protein
MTLYPKSQQYGFSGLAPAALLQAGGSGSTNQQVEDASWPLVVSGAGQGSLVRPSPRFFGGTFGV